MVKAWLNARSDVADRAKAFFFFFSFFLFPFFPFLSFSFPFPSPLLFLSLFLHCGQRVHYLTYLTLPYLLTYLVAS